MFTTCQIDKHKGRPCVILAGGPSVLRHNPAEAAGAVVIGINQHGVQLASQRGWPMPNYWLFVDVEAVDQNSYMFLRPPGLYPEPVKVCTAIPGAFLMGRGFKRGGTGKGGTFLEIETSSSMHPRKDDTALATVASTVGAALHLAVIFGCEPITILGLDLQADYCGRAHWYDAPGTVAPNSPVCAHQAEHLHAVIQRYVKDGVKIAVDSAEWLVAEPYVMPWERPAERYVKSVAELALKGNV